MDRTSESEDRVETECDGNERYVGCWFVSADVKMTYIDIQMSSTADGQSGAE